MDSFADHAERADQAQSRGEQHEGEDPGQYKEDQGQQTTTLSCCKDRRGAFGYSIISGVGSTTYACLPVQILDIDPDNDEPAEGAAVDLDSQRKGKCAVIKTTTRQTVFLPLIGLVPEEKLKPNDLVGVQKESYLVLDTLPAEYDSRVKAMEVDERPTEAYTDIGGLDKQIEELVEAIVLPMKHPEKFKALGIKPPKGALMYGPPGTGKTLLARACAAQTKACYLKLAGPSLVQMFIGDGAKLVRDAFELAKEKAPAIIFIDELDAIGTKRFDSDKSGDREVQRTMLELLNQLDGFGSDERIKVIAATNRIDILDPALLRSGRLDRKIEFPLPTEDARARIMEIHSRKMNVSDKVNFEELARSTDEFNGKLNRQYRQNPS